MLLDTDVLLDVALDREPPRGRGGGDPRPP